MIGHTPLLKMRRDGVLPSDVIRVVDSAYDFDRECARCWNTCPNPITGQLMPHVLLEQEDVPERVDFRFCISLKVHLEAKRDACRAQRLFKAIRDAQPDSLICVMPEHIWFFSKEQGGNGKRIHA